MANPNITEAALKWSVGHAWSISPTDIADFVNMHETGSPDLQQYVEAILEDCNFHSVNALMHEQMYNMALLQYDKDFPEEANNDAEDA